MYKRKPAYRLGEKYMKKMQKRQKNCSEKLT